jgi:hypothetical protein
MHAVVMKRLCLHQGPQFASDGDSAQCQQCTSICRVCYGLPPQVTGEFVKLLHGTVEACDEQGLANPSQIRLDQGFNDTRSESPGLEPLTWFQPSKALPPAQALPVSHKLPSSSTASYLTCTIIL